MSGAWKFPSRWVLCFSVSSSFLRIFAFCVSLPRAFPSLHRPLWGTMVFLSMKAEFWIAFFSSGTAPRVLGNTLNWQKVLGINIYISAFAMPSNSVICAGDLQQIHVVQVGFVTCMGQLGRSCTCRAPEQSRILHLFVCVWRPARTI